MKTSDYVRLLTSNESIGIKARKLRDDIFGLAPGGCFNPANKSRVREWNEEFAVMEEIIDQLEDDEAQSIVYESMAHRYGDQYLMLGYPSNKMIEAYDKALSLVPNYVKQFTTPAYWCSIYLHAGGDTTGALECLRRYFLNANQSDRHLYPGELLKAHDAIHRLRELDNDWNEWLETNITSKELQVIITTVKQHIRGDVDTSTTPLIRTSPMYYTQQFNAWRTTF